MDLETARKNGKSPSDGTELGDDWFAELPRVQRRLHLPYVSSDDIGEMESTLNPWHAAQCELSRFSC